MLRLHRGTRRAKTIYWKKDLLKESTGKFSSFHCLVQVHPKSNKRSNSSNFLICQAVERNWNTCKRSLKYKPSLLFYITEIHQANTLKALFSLCYQNESISLMSSLQQIARSCWSYPSWHWANAKYTLETLSAYMHFSKNNKK